MPIKTAVVAVLLAAALGACQPATRFEWGSYEPSLYAYYKDTAQRTQYRQALVSAIAAGTKSNKVAPGLHAELGYLYMEDGNFAEARVNFEREIVLFPESRLFLQGVIQRMSPAAASAGAAS
jgi:hypothetical protein